jgi:hypothetical protein
MWTSAIVLRRIGSPDVLNVERLDLAPLESGEARIHALASAMSSDLAIRAGNWNIRREPKLPSFYPRRVVTPRAPRRHASDRLRA